MQLPFTRPATAVLDGDGNGATSGIGPTAPGETWQVTLISVQCSSNASEALCSVYLGGSLVGVTTWGSTGDSDTGISLTVATGQQVTAKWTGGDPGATGTLAVIGVRTV